MTPLLCACAVVITLETQKCRKRAPRSVEFNFFLIIAKWFSQNERRADLQNGADDTSAYVSSQAPSVLNSDLQTTADSLSSWFSRWHLSVHPAKTVCMVLRSTGMPPCQLNIKINGNHIAQVTRHRHLGVTFNERLSWKDHVHDVLKKSAKKIGLLRRLGRQLSSTVVRDLYAFSIRPGIEYGSIVWSGLSSSDAARLERLNRSAARLITKQALHQTYLASSFWLVQVCRALVLVAVWPNAH